MLLHLVSLENQDVVKAYKEIRGELEKFGNGLPEKREIIVLTKTDLVPLETVSGAKELLRSFGNEILEVTVLDDASIKSLSDRLSQAFQ